VMSERALGYMRADSSSVPRHHALRVCSVQLGRNCWGRRANMMVAGVPWCTDSLVPEFLKFWVDRGLGTQGGGGWPAQSLDGRGKGKTACDSYLGAAAFRVR